LGAAHETTATASANHPFEHTAVGGYAKLFLSRLPKFAHTEYCRCAYLGEPMKKIGNSLREAENTPHFLTLSETARRLGVSKSTISKMAANGKIPVVRLSVSPLVPSAWLEKQAARAASLCECEGGAG
jgi:excisionase family DNA binding protein